MKKPVIILLSSLLGLSLSSCNSVPSDEKIKMALDDGRITIEDAKSKGWIDDEWITENFEQIEAKTKVHLFEPFETTYIDGTPTSSEIIYGKMCLVFFDTQKASTMDTLKIYNEVSDEMKEAGIPMLGILMDESSKDAIEKLSDIKFPIILYNDEMQKSLESYDDLLDNPVTSVFTKDGGFYSSWLMKATEEDLLSSARSLANEE